LGYASYAASASSRFERRPVASYSSAKTLHEGDRRIPGAADLVTNGIERLGAPFPTFPED
jgi:hypothetical protein